MRTLLLIALLAAAASAQTVYTRRPANVCFSSKATLAQLTLPAGSYHVTAKTVISRSPWNGDESVTCTLYSPATATSSSGWQDSAFTGLHNFQTASANYGAALVTLDAAFAMPAGKVSLTCTVNSSSLTGLCTNVTVLNAQAVATVVKQ